MSPPDHILPLRTYLLVYAALMLLLGATVGVAFFHIGLLGLVVALLIASIKTLLVVLYFMHVRYGARLVQLFAGAGFLWLAIMIALTLADYWTRSRG